MCIKKSGLTLVELLVVMAVMSILISSLYTVFNSSMEAWSRSDMRLEVFQNARAVLDQMSRELAGAMIEGAAGFYGVDGQGEVADSIEFVTFFDGALYQIKYTLNRGDNILVREYEKDPDDFANHIYTTTDFAGMIEDVSFQYWDPGVERNSFNTWENKGLDAWSSDTQLQLPRAVRIVIDMRSTKMEEGGVNAYRFEDIVYLPNSE